MKIDTTVRHWCKYCERATSSEACPNGCGPFTACAGCHRCSACGYRPGLRHEEDYDA